MVKVICLVLVILVLALVLAMPIGALVRGDVNGDGVVNMADIIKCERIILGWDSPTPGADVNGDGEIDMGDVVPIERIILGLE